MTETKGKPSNPTNPLVFFDIALAGECRERLILFNVNACFISLMSHWPLVSLSFLKQRALLIHYLATGEPLGRVQMELFADVTPKTAENFRQYCTGETKNAQGRPQGYKGSKFHRVVCQ